MKRCSEILDAADTDFTVMVAHHRLYDRQAQPGPMLFGGVVRRKQALAFFLRQSLAGICQLEDYRLAIEFGAEDELAALGHGVHRIEHQVLNDPAPPHCLTLA